MVARTKAVVFPLILLSMLSIIQGIKGLRLLSKEMTQNADEVNWRSNEEKKTKQGEEVIARSDDHPSQDVIDCADDFEQLWVQEFVGKDISSAKKTDCERAERERFGGRRRRRGRAMLQREGLPMEDIEDFETWDVGIDEDGNDSDDYEDLKERRAMKRMRRKMGDLRVKAEKFRAKRRDRLRAERIQRGEDVSDDYEEERALSDLEILAEYDDDSNELDGSEEEEVDAFDRNDLRDREDLDNADDADADDDSYDLKSAEELHQTKKAAYLFNADDDDYRETTIKKRNIDVNDEYEDVEETDFDYASENVFDDDENDVFREDDEYEDKHDEYVDGDDDVDEDIYSKDY